MIKQSLEVLKREGKPNIDFEKFVDLVLNMARFIINIEETDESNVGVQRKIEEIHETLFMESE